MKMTFKKAAATAWIFALLASPAFAYRDWIQMSWEGLPTGLTPNKEDVYFVHNNNDAEIRRMDDNGVIEVGEKLDVQHWGGSLHVPSTVTSPGGRSFHSPRISSVQPSDCGFVDAYLYYSSTWGDYKTGNVELDDGHDGNCRVTVTYTEQFRIVQHYSGITLTEPADMMRDIGSTLTLSTPRLLQSPAGSGQYYICTGWTSGQGIAADGTTNSVTISGISENVTLTWKYERAWRLGVTNLPAGFSGQPNLLIEKTDGALFSAITNGLLYYNAGSYQVSVDQAIAKGTDRYFCLGYQDAVLGGAASSGSGTVTDGRVKVAFSLDRDCQLSFVFQEQAKLVVAFDGSVPAEVRSGSMAAPAEGTHWYPKGTSVTATVRAELDTADGKHWVCTGWSGTGTVPATGTNESATITLSGVGNLTWRYQRTLNYTVNFDGLPVSYQGSGFTPPSGVTRFFLGSTQTLSAAATVAGAEGERFICDGWINGSGDVPGVGSTNRTTIPSVTQPSAITWKYHRECRLRIVVDPPEKLGDAAPSLPGTNWYRENTVITAMVNKVAGSSSLVGQALIGAAESGAPVDAGLRRGYVFNLTADAQIVWQYTISQHWYVGVPIEAPAGASNQQPVIQVVIPSHADDSAENTFFFGGPEGRKRLYPLRPLASALVTWPGAASNAIMGGYTTWPSNLQLHVGSVPVPLLSTNYAFVAVKFAENDASGSNKTFHAAAAGNSLLQFVQGALPDPINSSSKFVCVKTVLWNDPAYLTETNWAIGSAVTNALHKDGDRNGQLLFPNAFYDAVIYRRDTRLGTIIPVNRDTYRDDDDMAVVWFTPGDAALGLAWPTLPFRYSCQWPDQLPGGTVSNLVIASQKGSGPLSAILYPQGQLYVQPDPALPGYNPNEEHAALFDQGGSPAVFALRNDLNAFLGASEPYVLFKYNDPVLGRWAMKVFKVVAEDAAHRFEYPAVAGQPILPPTPISLLLPLLPQSAVAGGEKWYHRDHKGGHWAKAADPDGGDATVVMRWYYPLQAGFYFPDYDYDGEPDAVPGDPIPLLNGGLDTLAPPTNVRYAVSWPTNGFATLALGETLLKKKVPVFSMAAAEVIFDENLYRGGGPLAKLVDPLSERWVALDALPSSLKSVQDGARRRFPDLPYYLKCRLSWDPLSKRLYFGGVLDESGMGDPLLLPNIMSRNERQRLQDISLDWAGAVGQLFAVSRNPNGVEYAGLASVTNLYNPALVHTVDEWITLWGETQFGLRPGAGAVRADRILGLPKALTAGGARGNGWLVLAENDDASLGAAPVQLHVIRVGGEPVVGQIQVIKSDDVFDEKLTLRHSPDFGGDPDAMTFEWWYKPDLTGFAPDLPADAAADPDGDWKPFASGTGLQEITIEGASPLTLADNWFAVRYHYGSAYPFHTGAVHGIQKSLWAGQPGTDRRAQLAEGWIKRVVAALNPFDARVLDFHASPVNTVISMISQLGARYEGPIAFNGNPDNLNAIGLIEAYQTVLQRGLQFSIQAGISYGPANTALLNISTRLSDFYMLLGNEAYQDALDPTIGFGTASGEYGTLAPSIFAFQNQVPSLLEEELVLLRGRDDSTGPVGASPVYNRFIWNFTQGEGEVAYAQCYNISDQITADTDNNGYRDDTDGVINEYDARVMYPQGHGDAWGHYLSALRFHYNLLREPLFVWESRPEAVLVAGSPVTIDYLDERKFARAAAAKARTGAEIVNLTYRQHYVDDPAGQWQGYKDTDRDRAWGLDDWARRAGQGAYFDWVVANGLLPSTDTNPAHAGIARIEPSTLPELGEIAASYGEIQGQLDKADRGLNPLGLAKNVVPFDIDPAQVFNVINPRTHFEQMYDRALEAMKNAVAVFDYANQMTQMLRRNEDSREQFDQNLRDQERDFRNRLIEVFGYPYPDDIGPTGSYPSGYEGPDWLHFMYVDPSELTGIPIETIDAYDVTYDFTKATADQELGLYPVRQTVSYSFTGEGKYMIKPASWTAPRRAPGEIQRAISEFIQAQAALERALRNFDINILGEIENQRQLLESKFQARMDEIEIRNAANDKIDTIDGQILALHFFQLTLKRAIDGYDRSMEAICEGIPKVIGLFASDSTSGARAQVRVAASIIASCVGTVADQFEEAELAVTQNKEAVERDMEIELLNVTGNPELMETWQNMITALCDAEINRMEIATLHEQCNQAAARVLEVAARGQRLLEERAAWRKNNAPDIQEYRYQDMTFRTFRNDALQKYRAQFDLAARYVYLAAAAYDYETCLLGSQNGSGRQFLTDIVRHRALGQMLNGAPAVGRPGLADPLARLGQNFAVYKTQLGFNNPQTETSRFSLRRELFRIKGTNASDAAWRDVLATCRVPDLWAIPEYSKYCRPFAERSAGPQPGIVIRFPSCVKFGQNFFGWPLGGGDSTYDPTHFATKIRTVGTWFANYDGQGLSQTPRVYLVPTGADVMRSPSGDSLATREWKVVDQKVPVPFPIGDTDMKNEAWIPLNDTLGEDYGGIRRFSRHRAYHDAGQFSAAETVSDSRLIGRSVWNTQWMLIIPGETLLNPAADGLDTFIFGQPVPGGGGQRDGNGIKDILLFFQTYAYSGN